MNLRQIEVFHAIMQTGSISAAARLLSVSQPNISRLLRHTEDVLNLRLFERVRGKLLPTPEAHILFREVEHTYKDVETVRELARDLALGRSGRLQLVSSPSPGMVLMPQLVAAFAQTHPHVRLSLEILPQQELETALLTHQADLGLSLFASAHAGLVAEPLARGEMRCVAPPSHPLMQQAAVSPADLQPYRLISFDRDTPQGRAVDAAFTRAGVERDVAIRVRFGHTACALAQAGAGVAVVDVFSLVGFTGLESRPFRPGSDFTLSLLRPAGRADSAVARQFEAMVRSRVGREGKEGLLF